MNDFKNIATYECGERTNEREGERGGMSNKTQQNNHKQQPHKELTLNE